jgi:hypothetical protein
MAMKRISQRTMVAVMRAFRSHGTSNDELEEPPDVGELLYENDFPDWFVRRITGERYYSNWSSILPDLRNTDFFFVGGPFSSPGANITEQQYLSNVDAERLGETFIERLSALAATLPEGDGVVRSLELDGFQADKKRRIAL